MASDTREPAGLPFFFAKSLAELAGSALVVARRARAAGRTAGPRAQGPDIEVQLGDGAAESIAVHTELAGRLTLVAFVVLQHRKYEAFLEFADSFGVENAALVHLENQGFQLVFHSASLYSSRLGPIARCINSSYRRQRGKCAPEPSAAGSTHR